MNRYLKIVVTIICVISVVSCKNDDWDFPDYAYTSVYFPYQSPIRTLVLGDYDQVDNTKDQKLQFSIGVSLGGLYENKIDRTVSYIIDKSLLENLSLWGSPLVALPEKYYSLSNKESIIIPKGKMQGYLDIQLTEEFLEDPLSHYIYYVLPLRITAADTDTILSGKVLEGIFNPDPRVSSHWTVTPKNYTLYAIKYFNPYHGKYLHRGKNVVKNASGDIVDEVVYRAKFIEQNEIQSLETTAKKQVSLTSFLRRTSGSDDYYTALLNFDDNGNCSITESSSSQFKVTGNGKFVREGDVWGGKKRNTITISYQIEDTKNNLIHNVTDTLVMRDRDVKLETFPIEVN